MWRRGVSVAIVSVLLASDAPASGWDRTADRDRRRVMEALSSGVAPLNEPCVAFSPYISSYNPNTGPHPPREIIGALLDRLLVRTRARCIMTYGVLNGLDEIFELARGRGVKVIAIIYLDRDRTINDRSIERGVMRALAYPDTIVRLSCGSEVRTRHGRSIAEPIVRDCVSRLRAAGVTQPITAIDTWWHWCNEAASCQPWSLANDLDWIGINIYPWWENRYSPLHPCTTAEQAADFHVARWSDVARTYPDKEVVVTEFGWPSGPDGHREPGLGCGVASPANQRLVVDATLARWEQQCLAGVVFSAFPEQWKVNEGPVGPYWGILPFDGSYVAPTRPLNFSSAFAGTTATFRWTPPLIGPILAYQLEAGTVAGASNVAVLRMPPTASSLMVPGIPAGTFFVRLRALSPYGMSEASNEVMLTYPTSIATPHAPTGLSGTGFDESVALSWQASPTGGIADSYVLEAGMRPGETVASIPFRAQACFAQNGVPPGTYYVRVRASNAAGVSPASNEVAVVVGTPVPGAPSNLAVVTGPGGSVALTWVRPTSGGNPTGYAIEAGSASGLSNLVQMPVGASTSFSASGVPPGRYFVRVRAVNRGGLSPASNEVIVDAQ
jgi:exo-beta-1,3-glucanase (GH17 family)